MAKKDRDESGEEAMLDEGSGPRVYELGFHLDPELPLEEVKKAYQSVHDAIIAHGAVIAEGEPEKIQLAYTISRQEPSGRRDFDSAFFAWIAYESDAARHAEGIEALKREARVIRFLDVVTTKEAARHSAEAAELKAKAPEKKEGDEGAVSDAALDAALEHAGV